MNLEIIKINKIDNNLETTKLFGLLLNNILSNIKMMHWYTDNYNVHKILGEDYDTLSDLFDKIQEEIIGTSKESQIIFPMINSNSLDNIDYTNIIESYKNLVTHLKNNLNGLEFNNYLTSVSTGINNTKEEIISEVNKTLYLLSLNNS
jgi:DNA-binding ferritin-like protein